MSETTNETKPKSRKKLQSVQTDSSLAESKPAEPVKEVLRIADIVDPGFTATVTKIIKSDIPMLTAFKLERSFSKANEIITRYNKIRFETLKKYSKLNPDGTLEVDESGNVKFKDQDGAKAFFEEERKLLMEEVNLGTYKLEDLGSKVELSVMDVGRIRLLFDKNSLPSI